MIGINRLIHPLTRRSRSESAGNKGASLVKMMGLGLPVPKSYFCDWAAYQRFNSGDHNVLEQIERELQGIISPTQKYAIRSSANLEDSEDYSFAGQFDTILNVQGLIPDVIEAIQAVWSSVQSPVVRAYLERHNIPDTDLRMTVLIQEMVSPLYSGVALSKNPVTGADEVVVEAIQGEGSRLVQDGYTPERWVNKWGYWLEKNDSSGIPLSLIQQIVDQVNNITARIDYPIDTEWVFDGKTLYWVQMREITTIKKHNVYSNYMAKEMLPGLVKPLPFHISARIMSRTVLKWLGEMLGPLPIDPDDLVKSYYYHAYFNMGALGQIFKSYGFPAESMEMLIGVLPPSAAKMKFKPSLKTLTFLPRAIFFLLTKIGFENRIAVELEELESRVFSSAKEDLNSLSIAEIMNRLDGHNRTMARVSYHTTLSLFFLSMFNRVFKQQLAKRGVELNNFDVTENMPELACYYPSTHLEELNRQYLALPPETRQYIASATFQQLKETPGLEDFTKRFSSLVEKFGHLGTTGNDFSLPTWYETPEALLKMVIDYQPLAHDLVPKVRLVDLKNRHQVSPMFVFFYRHSRLFQYLRERSSCLYTHSKVLFRSYYLALGRHFVLKGVLDNPEDIFYLTPEQVEEVARGTVDSTDMRALVAKHKEDIQHCREVQLPSVIYGDNPPPVRKSNARIMPGVSASLGCYTGRTCVVRDENDFQKLKHGEVLVIPYSDVSWAPLFARAGALISESGGLLSHGSIVAREYNIPAIVSVEQATSLPDGILVTVDAHQGIVQLLSEPA